MMKNRSETFGRLLKAGIGSIVICEGTKAPVVEDDLGQQIGVSADAIQRYKAGALPPEPRTVQILADACVRRGFMNREWLQSFLHAARYHQSDKLLDQLCPLGPIRPRPPRVYENLPAPTYSQFVNRPQVFAEVADGLGKRTAAVLIVGMGGNGKTSLAREVAACCLRDGGEVPHFDAVVWVSDKDRPGTTNLSIVLDETARTLDYPGFTQFDHDEKRREVEQLLKRQRVLLVLDNIETVTDGALLTWLLNLPEPSKALITSREKHRALWSSWLVELRGMSDAEAQTLIAQRLQALQLSKIAGGDLAHFEPLITVTGGNPKAIEMTLGLVKHERRPLQQVVDDLYAARGNLFDDLFARAWALLDEAARRVLLVATFFPASASGEALSATADVQGFAFDRAVERLADLALLDVQQVDLHSPPRYVLHPLVRAFAGARLAEQAGFEEGARLRWAADLEARVSQAIARQPYWELTVLAESDLSARTFLDWANRTEHWESFLTIYRRVAPFWSVRGLFDVRNHYTGLAIAIARSMGRTEDAVNFLASYARLKAYMGDRTTAEHSLAEAMALRSDLANKAVSLGTNNILAISRTDAQVESEKRLTTVSLGTNNILAISRAVLDLYAGQPAAALATLFEQQPESLPNEIAQNEVAQNQHDYWIGRCLIELGRYVEAQSTLERVLERAERIGSARTGGNSANLLVAICIAQGDVDGAAHYHARSITIAKHVNDQRQIAELRRVTGRLWAMQGNIPAARSSLAEAIDRFERLGMRRELAEARAELARLDASDAPIIGASGA